MFIIKNGEVYESGKFARKDLMITGQIEKIGNQLDFEGVQTIDAENMKVVPGFIDLHNHVNGAGGEGGPTTRTTPVTAGSLLKAGITTVVGLLGTDGYTRSLVDLLFHVRKLRNEMDAYMYSGSYQVPGPSITESVGKDIVLVPEIVGVKMALSDHRCSFPDRSALLKTVTDVRVSSMLAGKTGIVMTHMGSADSMFDPIYDVVDNTAFPIKHFVTTHIGRSEKLMEAAREFAKKGGNIDLTASSLEKTLKALKFLSSIDTPVDRLTITTDGNGSLPHFSKTGILESLKVAPCDVPLKVFVYLMKNAPEEVPPFLKMVSENPADRLGVKKGMIREGYDADLLLFGDDLTLKYVISKGRVSIAPDK